MLISSSFLSTAAWQTEQVKDSTNVATQLFSPQVSRNTEDHRDVPAKPAVNEPHVPSASASPRERTSRTSDQKGAVRAESHQESRRKHNRSEHRKAADGERQVSNEPTNNAEPPAATTAADPVQFLAILSEVLPQDMPSGAGTAQHVANPEVSSGTNTPLTSSLPGATSTPNLKTAAAPLATPVFAGKESTSSTEAPIPAAPHDDVTQQIDPSFEIRKEAIPTDPRLVLNQKPSGQAEVAFAARVTERPATVSALSLNDAQASIAASRFDASASGSHADTRDNPEPQVAIRKDTSAPVNSATEQVSDQPSQAPPDSTVSAGYDVPRATVTPNTAERSVSAQATTPAAAISATVGSRPVAGLPNASPGMPVAPGVSAAAPDARSSATAKSAATGRAPQFLEPQNEPAERTAGESVRDISLQLADKDQGRVQVRLSERAGELHVSVRTPDAGLTRGLRDGLSDLVGRLEHNGYRAETWQPAGRSATSAQDQSHDSPSQNHSSGQQNAEDSGGGGGRQQSGRDQQHPDAQPPKWVSELESSIQRSNSSWPASAIR